jgi:predicted HTH domain antitoxin
MTRTLHVDYDDALLLSSGLPSQEFEKEAVLAMAGKLFEMGRISSGRAARMCGMERVEFLHSLEKVGISLNNMRLEDADDEIAFALGH